MTSDDSAGATFRRAGMVVLERGWLSSNGVLFPAAVDAPSTLVDTGYVSHSDQTVDLVAHALGDSPLERVVNTHLHSDHCGGNAALQARHGCEILIPAGEWNKVSPWDETRLTFRATGQHCRAFQASGVLTCDHEIQLGRFDWRVLSAPGHDPESVVLYQPDERLLISADALWENGFGVVFPEIEGVDAFDEVEATLDMIATLEVDWVVPGHGRPFGDVAGALERARQRLGAFRSDPRRHATHAAKVLLKFHMLEVRRQTIDALRGWAEQVPYLRLLHESHFDGRDFAGWFDARVQELLSAAALARKGGEIVDA